MNNGIIERLNEKGFGFIKIQGNPKSVFFHASQLKGSRFTELQEGDNVTFEDLVTTDKGQHAVAVSLNY